MKASEIKVGETYLAKVTDKVVAVRIERENPHGGWDAMNLTTGKAVRIKSAQRLRGPASRVGKATDTATPTADTAPAKAGATPKKAAKQPKAAKEPKAKKLSALNAAAQVLADTGTAMTTGEMIEAMSKAGYWSSPNGATPAATLYSAILRELKVKGPAARFVKTERGKFALAGNA